MGTKIFEFIQTQLAGLNISAEYNEVLARVILGLIVVVAAILGTYISKWIITSPLKKLAFKSKAKWEKMSKKQIAQLSL